MKTKTEVKRTPIPIPQCSGYGATKDGKIWSLKSNWRGYGIRPITPCSNRRGYLKVRLQFGDHRKNITVHRLIAATFLPIKPSPEFEVRHLNGNPLDNRAKNLVWGTRQDNAIDRVEHWRTYRPDWSNPDNRKRWCASMRRKS